ncbi:thiamine-triphosphatase isoform X1 [Bufo gargarizans]|uniref:thiamine-triphosphatase isoform X1 n=2 Tax=Bufo gargarizans TaxID=30331 RepID=UPI001CF3CAD2|nr:thiamine-triphosphatase isoform X1 [Bufo gargarizans]XP_044143904.1 thiamine-triphosphatase isoform X1 [Bufo gargarizans]
MVDPVSSIHTEMSPSSQLPGLIEVERKFVPGPDVEIKLCALGAKLLEEITFRDSYYDGPDLRLTLNDMWLRRRGDSWELKHPPQRGAKGLKGASTQYMELTSEDDIIRRVSEELGVPCPPNIESFGLNEFASFVTRRRRFLLPLAENSDSKVVVDLDEADFGFTVGEVEVLVKTQEEVENAFKKVEEICRLLGVFRETPVQGKVSTFLQMNRADLYRQLLEAHVL